MDRNPKVFCGVVDGVEEGLELGFDVEDGILGLAFVRSADGDEDAERTRERSGRSGPGSEVAAQEADSSSSPPTRSSSSSTTSRTTSLLRARLFWTPRQASSSKRWLVPAMRARSWSPAAIRSPVPSPGSCRFSWVLSPPPRPGSSSTA